MKKKIAIISFLAVLFLISVSMASAINTADIKKEKKESPLFGIRTNRAISEKIQNIKTKFFGNKLFFLPFQLIRNNNQNIRERLNEKEFTVDSFTCNPTGYCSCSITSCSPELPTCGGGVTCTDFCATEYDYTCQVTCGITCKGGLLTCSGPLCE